MYTEQRQKNISFALGQGTRQVKSHEKSKSCVIIQQTGATSFSFRFSLSRNKRGKETFSIFIHCSFSSCCTSPLKRNLSMPAFDCCSVVSCEQWTASTGKLHEKALRFPETQPHLFLPTMTAQKITAARNRLYPAGDHVSWWKKSGFWHKDWAFLFSMWLLWPLVLQFCSL